MCCNITVENVNSVLFKVICKAYQFDFYVIIFLIKPKFIKFSSRVYETDLICIKLCFDRILKVYLIPRSIVVYTVLFLFYRIRNNNYVTRAI